MTKLRDEIQKKFDEKVVDYDELFEKFEQKSMQFINERQAHNL